MQQQEWYIERERLLGRIKELEAENAELRKRLGEDVMPIERKPSAMQILSLQEKGDLFRSLFKGREDVFARRWYSKTVSAIGLIAKHGVNTLVLVHTKALLDQWVKALEQFLTIDTIPEENEGKRKRRKSLSPIGTLSSTGNKRHGIIDIALMQSCISGNDVKFFVKDYGMVIADECHHISAVNFEQILKAVNAHYVYGLTCCFSYLQ